MSQQAFPVRRCRPPAARRCVGAGESVRSSILVCEDDLLVRQMRSVKTEN